MVDKASSRSIVISAAWIFWLILFLMTIVVFTASAQQYREGDILYGEGRSIVGHVGMIVRGDSGELVVQEAMMGTGIQTRSISQFLADYTDVALIKVRDETGRIISDETAHQAAIALKARSEGLKGNFQPGLLDPSVFSLNAEMGGDQTYCSLLIQEAYNTQGIKVWDQEPGKMLPPTDALDGNEIWIKSTPPETYEKEVEITPEELRRNETEVQKDDLVITDFNLSDTLNNNTKVPEKEGEATVKGENETEVQKEDIVIPDFNLSDALKNNTKVPEKEPDELAHASDLTNW